MTKWVGQKFPLLQEEVAKTGAAAAEARFHGAQRDVQRLRDLLIAEALHVAEDDGRALVRGERHQAGLDVAAELAAENGLFRRLRFVGQVKGQALATGVVERYLRTALAAPEFIGAGVGGDPEQPGAEDAAAIAVDATVRGQEDVLRQVLGGMAGGEHPQA